MSRHAIELTAVDDCPACKGSGLRTLHVFGVQALVLCRCVRVVIDRSVTKPSTARRR